MHKELSFEGPIGTLAYEAIVCTTLRLFERKQVKLHTKPVSNFIEIFNELDDGVYVQTSWSSSAAPVFKEMLYLLSQKIEEGRFPYKIIGEVKSPAFLHLLCSGRKTANIQEVFSHQNVFPVCSDFLKSELGSAKQQAYGSTMYAAQQAYIKGSHAVAAIATQSAVDINGYQILKRNVGNPDSYLRFLLWGPKGHASELTGEDRTALFLSKENIGEDAAKIVGITAGEGVKEVVFEQVPGVDSAYLEFKAHVEEKQGRVIVSELERMGMNVLKLGSFPIAQDNRFHQIVL